MNVLSNIPNTVFAALSEEKPIGSVMGLKVIKSRAVRPGAMMIVSANGDGFYFDTVPEGVMVVENERLEE